MAIENTVIDNERVITPNIITKSIKTGDAVINKIVSVIVDDEGALPTGAALQPWLDQILIDVDNRLDEFEQNTIFSYTHPATHPASMITETAARVWFTPDERTKLETIADNANYYIHPETHSADMITPTADRVWPTPAERTKLAGIAPNANNYVHPMFHPVGILNNFLTWDGFIRPELIEALQVQRINVRHSVLSGFTWTFGTTTEDYYGAPLIEPNVVVGTNQYIVRITPTVNRPLVGTIANGFSVDTGNVDSLIRVTDVIETASLHTYGFAPNTEVWVCLLANGLLDVISTKPVFDSISMTCNIAGVLPIMRAVISSANNYLTDITVLTPGRYLAHETDYIPYDTTAISIPNRLMTDKIICQILIQKEGETTWTVLDNTTLEDHEYNVKLKVNDHHLTLETLNYITQIMPQAKFRIYAFRIY